MEIVANASYSGADQRTSPRMDVYARLPVTLPDGRSVIVTVVNMSADGLLMRHDGQLAEGATLTVSLPVIGRIDAHAVWSLGGRAGLKFATAISASDYYVILKAMGAKIDNAADLSSLPGG